MDENISIWLVGNTGLRSPDRIQDGLQVFAQSPYVGNLHGRENEVGFMNYLDQKGIIQNTEGKDASGSHARKWRLMFARHGFIYPQITRSDGFEQEELGRLDDLTPFGRVFLQADTFPAVQECFLRASSVEQYKMPDILHFGGFSRLCLNWSGEQVHLNYQELNLHFGAIPLIQHTI